MKDVLAQYNITAFTTQGLGNGLINTTLLVKTGNNDYVLQKINTSVFKNPYAIADNIDRIHQYLKKNHPGYIFTAPLPAQDGKTIVVVNNEYYRLYNYVKNSHTIDVVQTPQQAYEAAKQFGKFSAVLKGFDVSQLQTTIPDFHNITLRYQQFSAALQRASQERLQNSNDAVEKCRKYKHIVEEFEKIKANSECKLRVIHHDTKISNVLFDESNKGICIIDLDTVMPGYFISDVGDMMRTYLCPVSEEETDITKIAVRKEMYEAIVKGYSAEMKDELTKTEKKYFFYAGVFMICMQALRFLTDYLNNDVYYGAKYPGHNLNRAKNQLALLKGLFQKETEWKGISV